MNLEDQVVSIEYAKKLKDSSISQKSIYIWIFYDNKYNLEPFFCECEAPCYSAFTASELMSLLPARITLKEDEPFNSFKIRIEKSSIVKGEMLLEPKNIFPVSTYIINYYCDSTEVVGENAWLQRTLFPKNIWDENFCNALAKTLIAIYENKFLCTTN